MAGSTYEHELFEKLQEIRKVYRAPKQVLQSLYVRMLLEYSVYMFTKARFQKLINEALDQKNEERFYELSTRYNQWVNGYKSGNTISQHGYELECNFEDQKEPVES